MADDTIVAISTAVGESAIGIVRLSGKDALKIGDTIFKGTNGVVPSRAPSHTVHYGWAVDKKGRTTHNTQRIDEVLLTVMRAPRTYTKEDIIEINCHGGARALRNILELVVRYGARLAEPGEFTKRAFLNGRIDLSKAEAVLDVIKAKTDAALKLGIEQLSGRLSHAIHDIRQELIGVLAHIEAAIDFSDEDIAPKKHSVLQRTLAAVIEQLEAIIRDSKKVDFFREGIKVVICGRPNVGKSSLLNALVRKERSIVTPVAGTTRDIIEEFIALDGIGIRLVDTAGMLKPKDLIEHHAIRLTKNSIALSDLVLLVFDGSQKLTQKDRQLMSELKNKDVIAVINKVDLPQQLSKQAMRRFFTHVVCVSSLTRKNLGTLEKAIVRFVYKGKIVSSEGLVTTNARQINEVQKAKDLLVNARQGFVNRLSLEFVALDVKLALDCLDRITGEKVDDAILERIFGEFCVGK